jgi:hypothetical protein
MKHLIYDANLGKFEQVMEVLNIKPKCRIF